ncbi:protein E33A [Elephant endotheliotropic herpesvirus 6]|nr:protein E33A [Elephant endotheliotropic herpesvirus 6]
MYKKTIYIPNTRRFNTFIDKICIHAWLIILMSCVLTLILIDICWFMYCTIVFRLFSKNPQFTFTYGTFIDLPVNCTNDVSGLL